MIVAYSASPHHALTTTCLAAALAVAVGAFDMAAPKRIGRIRQLIGEAADTAAVAVAANAVTWSYADMKADPNIVAVGTLSWLPLSLGPALRPLRFPWRSLGRPRARTTRMRAAPIIVDRPRGQRAQRTGTRNSRASRLCIDKKNDSEDRDDDAC
jgi:hypothetical protein